MRGVLFFRNHVFSLASLGGRYREAPFRANGRGRGVAGAFLTAGASHLPVGGPRSHLRLCPAVCGGARSGRQPSGGATVDRRRHGISWRGFDPRPRRAGSASPLLGASGDDLSRDPPSFVEGTPGRGCPPCRRGGLPRGAGVFRKSGPSRHSSSRKKNLRRGPAPEPERGLVSGVSARGGPASLDLFSC